MVKSNVYTDSRLYYIHGYLSNPKSIKGTILKEKLGVIPIKYRDCPPENLVIRICVDNIKKEIEYDKNIVLIGSSLGGFLAAKAALEVPVKKLILLNPAIIPLDVDISKIQGMPHEILRDMQDERLFAKKINSEITILVGLQDEVVPNRWSEVFAKKQNAKILFFEDDHSFTKNNEKLPDIITNILEKKD
jgi:predicted esterase YcpF (UPF0227 family)